MLATGWTTAELRAQPARVVRALAWRLFAAQVWSPELEQAANVPLKREPGTPAQPFLDALRARDDARAALREIESALWPEDADGQL